MLINAWTRLKKIFWGGVASPPTTWSANSGPDNTNNSDLKKRAQQSTVRKTIWVALATKHIFAAPVVLFTIASYAREHTMFRC